MNTVALSGDDTTILNDRVLNDLADGDAVMLAFESDRVNVKVGKNGNSIYALNETGRLASVTIRVIRGSSDDKFLNGIMVNQFANLASFVLMTGEFIKQVGNGLGSVAGDTYILSGGAFTRQIDAKMNTDGDTEQSVAVYRMKFSNAPRTIT